MNILVLNYEYPPIGGGGGFVTRDIMECLAEEGHHITVITSGYPSLPSREICNGVAIHRVPVLSRQKLEVASMESMLSYLPSGFWHSFFECRLRKYDIINTHFAIPTGPLGCAISKLFDIPNVLTIHGGDIYDPSKSNSPHRKPLLSQIVRQILNSSDRVVAQSTDTRANAFKYHKPSCPIDIIPLGIKRPIIPETTRDRFAIGLDDTVFCTIGRLVKRKNLIDTLNLVAKLKHGKKVRLLVVGDGPERNNIEAAIKTLNLEHEVILLGNVSDDVKFQALSISDIFISTALHEGFGLVFLEAMACGLPILSFNKGGQTDFLRENLTGFLAAQSDPMELFSKGEILVNDALLRKRIGDFNRKYVENYYIEACADRYIRLFESIIENRRKVARKMFYQPNW